MGQGLWCEIRKMDSNSGKKWWTLSWEVRKDKKPEKNGQKTALLQFHSLSDQSVWTWQPRFAEISLKSIFQKKL